MMKIPTKTGQCDKAVGHTSDFSDFYILIGSLFFWETRSWEFSYDSYRQNLYLLLFLMISKEEPATS